MEEMPQTLLHLYEHISVAQIEAGKDTRESLFFRTGPSYFRREPETVCCFKCAAVLTNTEHSCMELWQVSEGACLAAFSDQGKVIFSHNIGSNAT